jgi:hypothetical protein
MCLTKISARREFCYRGIAQGDFPELALINAPIDL